MGNGSEKIQDDPKMIAKLKKQIDIQAVRKDNEKLNNDNFITQNNG